MRTLVLLFTAMAMFNAPVFADDNIANCEVVVEKIGNPNDVVEGELAVMDFDFLPADDFIYSVFKPDSDPIKQIDGNVIRGLMCTRSNVVPTEFDLKLIKTGVPLYLSQNFDSTDSSLMSISGHEGKYTYMYDGPDLPKDEQDMLELRLQTLNTEHKETKEKDGKSSD